MSGFLCVLAALFGMAISLPPCINAFSTASAESLNHFVGSAACADCHGDEYERFTTHAKKAKSDKNVQKMASNLKPHELEGCYECHTTGYGQPGGFVSYEETPELGHAGCEVCHGPGQAHIESGGDPDTIKGELFFERDCKHCHISERLQLFDFRPLTKAGAH